MKGRIGEGKKEKREKKRQRKEGTTDNEMKMKVQRKMN